MKKGVQIVGHVPQTAPGSFVRHRGRATCEFIGRKQGNGIVYVALCSKAMAQTKKLEVSLQPHVAAL